jgi:hypothetical protein
VREVPGSIPGAALLLEDPCTVFLFKGVVEIRFVKMVPRGLEPRTLRLLAVRSNQLSYETVCFPFEQTTTLEPTSICNRPGVVGTGDNRFFLHNTFFVVPPAYFTVGVNQSSDIMR